MSNKQFRPGTNAGVVIIGGGVIGLSIARELASRGAHDIILLERGELGKEASWAAGGILAPQVEAHHADEFFKLACASRDMYPAFATSLMEETGIDVELDQTGTLNVAFDEHEERELRRIFNWQTTHGLRVDFWRRRARAGTKSFAEGALRAALSR